MLALERRPDWLFAAARERCRSQYLEPPLPERLERLMRSVWTACLRRVRRVPSPTRLNSNPHAPPPSLWGSARRPGRRSCPTPRTASPSARAGSAFFCSALAPAPSRPCRSPGRWQPQWSSDLDAVMALAPTYRDGQRLRKRYGRVRSHLFTFLDHSEVWPTTTGPSANCGRQPLIARSPAGSAPTGAKAPTKLSNKPYAGRSFLTRVEQLRLPSISATSRSKAASRVRGSSIRRCSCAGWPFAFAARTSLAGSPATR